MQNNIELIMNIVEPSVLNELDKICKKLKDSSKCLLIPKGSIMTYQELVKRISSGIIRSRSKRNHHRNTNKKPQLRKTK